MADSQERHEGGEERFFSVKKKDEEKKDSTPSSLNQSTESDENQKKGCLTFRILQFLLPCLKSKGVWEPSQGDVFKSHDAEEAKYPRTLKILESKIFDVIFVSSCFLSIYLFLFSEGFLIESRLLWGIIHLVNAVYAMGLFSQWLQILIKSKYAKMNHGYTTKDIVYTLLSVFPTDLIMLAIYTLNDDDDNDDDSENPIKYWMITVSRLNYFLRIRGVLQYFSKWEDHLVVGDFRMFMMRTVSFTTFLLHMFACIWHRLACESFKLKHFLMTPDEATVEVCSSSSWLGLLQTNKQNPLLDHPDWHVLVTHYFVSMYWTVVASFRLGAGDIKTSLNEKGEVAFVIFAQITAWIYVFANITGALTSLLIEKDTEKQNFLTRCFAIRRYLSFGEGSRVLQEDVTKFYQYLWDKSRGIRNLDLVELIPHAMKSEIYYDVNKFVLDQLPMLKGLETPFLMSLSVHTNHKFYLRGEILFRKNETAQGLYYIVKGQLEILSDDEQHSIATIRSGSAIGELHLLQPYPHVATVRCGSDCDILVLRRKHFKRVISIYPQYITTLDQRLETRLEQSALVVALCEKHNLYHNAFKALRELKQDQLESVIESSQFRNSFDNLTKILDATADYDALERGARDSDDFDGLNLSTDMVDRINTRQTGPDKVERKNYEELLSAAYLALEADVARAGSLANDLNIPRPPLLVTVPDSGNQSTLGFRQANSGSALRELIQRLKEPTKGRINFVWKFVVSLCALLAFWYYLYQFAFRELAHIKYDYCAHFMDVIFALDCIYDMIQIVVTPQKTFESAKEIAVYRLKSTYFYVRVFSFLPLEYLAVPLVGNGQSLSPYFYIFKFNRLLEIHLIFQFMSDFETRTRIPPILLYLAKFALGLFYVTHIVCVAYSFVIRDVNGNRTTYLHAFYWALTVVCSVGYGDFTPDTDPEVAVETLGLIFGASTLIYMNANVSSILVNSERRRMSFKQTYYGLQEFMKQRKFPTGLLDRVRKYYMLQWRTHQGTLIPTGKPVIWDAPRSLVTTVAHAHSYQYLTRLPLFKDTPVDLQKEFCVALMHFIIPPGEIILYPNELARDLYIIYKGFCEVIHQGKQIGVFSKGRYFGMNGLLNGVNTDYKFRTITHCHIFCLSHENFMKVANTNPNFLHEFRILTVEDQMSRYRNLSLPNEIVESPYPTESFISGLVEAAPPEAVSIEDYDTGHFHLFLRNMSTRFKVQCTNAFLLPNGLALKCWMTFRVTVVVFVTIFTSMQLVFSIPPRVSFAVTCAFDIIAWIDMYNQTRTFDELISFRIAYYGPDNQLVIDCSKMASHYMKGPFLIDIIGSFPADYIAYFYLLSTGSPIYKNLYHVVSLLRMNRVLQCCKLLIARSMLSQSIYKSLSFVMLLEVMPLMFIFINVTLCFAVITVCELSIDGLPVRCNPNAWILKGMQSLDYTGSTPASGYVLNDAFRSYLIGLYWVTQTILCVGFGDIDIGIDLRNQRVAITVIFFGLMVTSFMSGKLTSCIVGDDPTRMLMQERMVLVNSCLEQLRVSKNCRRRVRETYFSAWDKTKGVSPKSLFVALPPTLKTDIMKQLYGPQLRSSALFRDLDAPGLRMLAKSLTEIFYPEGEFLMKFGDLSNDVFFIAQGAVVCYNVRGDIMAQMGSGSLIGEIAGFFHTHRLYSAIAVKDVNAYIFKKEAFMSFLAQYPDIRKVVESCSLKHYKEAMMSSKKAEKMDFNVMITYQNETTSTIDPQFPALSGEGLTFSQDSNSQVQSNTDEQDVTRTAVTADVSRNPEDFSKSNTDRWWSLFVTFGRMARDEMGLIHVYQESGQCNIFNFAIHPASAVCNWVSFCLVLTALSCSITSYRIAFSSRISFEITTLQVIRYALEVFYIVRLIGNFHLGFYDETGNLIIDVKTISRRYMKKWDGFWMDVVASLPFYLISDFMPMLQMEFIRGLQLLRVWLFVRYLNETESDLKMNASRAKILKITILLLFIFHFWACAWYLVACYEMTCTRGSWMDKTLTDMAVTNGISPSSVPTTTRYLLSLYYVTNALTFTGFSEISARTNIELFLTVLMIFATVFVIGYLVGEMTQCLASQVATKIHYQHKLSVLESHFLTLGLSYTKIAEVRHYFKLLWCKCKGVMLFNLLDELPYPLRADVAMEIYGPNLKSSRILGKLDENLIRQLSAKIQHEIYFPGSHIVRAGDVCTSMYFIKKGEVVILDGNSNLELCVEVLYEMECFGEVKILLPREQYRFSYIARLESEVGVLQKEDLEAVLKNHPKIYDELKDKANRVKTRRQSLKEEEERGNGHGGTSALSIKSGTSQTSLGKATKQA